MPHWGRGMRGRVVDVPVHKGALEPHNFVGKREYGLNPKPGDRCALCMVPKAQHMVLPVPCEAWVNFEGAHYQCKLAHPHAPLGHEFYGLQLVTLGHDETLAAHRWQATQLKENQNGQ